MSEASSSSPYAVGMATYEALRLYTASEAGSRASEAGQSRRQQQQQQQQNVPTLTARPCMHPLDRTIVDELGSDPGPLNCWLCRRGSSSDAEVGQTEIDAMVIRYLSLRGEVPDHELAAEISQYFEENVRRPVNDRLGQNSPARIPELSTREVYWHLRRHMNDPTSFMLETIGTLRLVMNQLRDNGLFVEYDDTGAVQVAPEGLRAFERAFNIAMRTYNSRPSSMFMHSNATDGAAGRFINPIRPSVARPRRLRTDADIFRLGARRVDTS